MDYKKIESLKLALISLASKRCRVVIPSYGINGRIIGVGFKPYWTSPVDSKIEKLEINLVDDYGRPIPFNFYNVVGYTVISNDGQGYSSMKNACLDIHIYSPDKGRSSEPFDKVRVDIFAEA